MRLKNLYFQKVPRWRWHCWPEDHWSKSAWSPGSPALACGLGLGTGPGSGPWSEGESLWRTSGKECVLPGEKWDARGPALAPHCGWSYTQRCLLDQRLACCDFVDWAERLTKLLTQSPDILEELNKPWNHLLLDLLLWEKIKCCYSHFGAGSILTD